MQDPLWENMRRFDEVWRRVEHARRPPPPPPPPRPGPPQPPPPPPGPGFPPPPPPPKPCRRSFRFNPHGYWH